MSEPIRHLFATVLTRSSWPQELAGILPLSALIDFLEVSHILHIFQLTGAIPLWCWPITPSGSRLLLSEQDASDSCCLDRFGKSMSLTCLDGKYGDLYVMASPETLRLCLQTSKPTHIPNDHPNMKQSDVRLQTLEVVRVSRAPQRRLPRLRRRKYIVASAAGWVILAGLIATAAVAGSWVALAFLVIMPLTGGVVYLVHGGRPRRLGAKADSGSRYNRLVVVTRHMNESHWQVYYGESSVVNSLLNWPLRSEPLSSRRMRTWLRMILRVLILGQWAAAIGAAALKDWNAYLITIWIVICIFSHTFVFSAKQGVKSWLWHFADIEMERFTTQLSSRRALLNTIIALNPDTFSIDRNGKEKLNEFDCGSLLWIDPILKAGPDRSMWEEATRQAMIEERDLETEPPESESGSPEDQIYPSWEKVFGDRYWCKYIPEGMTMASMIRSQARLSGRFVEAK
ncbi:hypothetical protein F4801DRAFT_504837 [Xylaria longipes]|nr:hypothetical protein F4801DRAFT_504837 [Xylaria longipes]RYC54742.1 hypothetical protein CHU98_g11467 [Xylaria longipes]